MSIQGPSPLPPTTITSSHAIPQSSASDFLSAYLDRAATDPALQPNASISEHGPVSRTTASAPNLILHNLKRVQAGLAGDVLGRDLTMIKMNPEEESTVQIHGEGEQGLELEQAQAQEQGQDGEEMEVDDSGAVDKEERKRKKKERRLAEKKAKSKGEA